jgi:sodium/bile acid cotransporter 7
VGAIFNAVLSNLLGIVLTPLWAAWLMNKTGESRPLGSIIREVILSLLLPLAVGQLLRLRFAGWIDPRKKRFSNLSSCLILFIVFASFCNSMKAHVWQKYGWLVTGKAAAGVLLLFFTATLLADGLAWLFRLNRGDKIVSVFSSPHKTLASGIPMAKAIFSGHPGFTLIILPLMFYHPLQLFVCGLIADRYARGNRNAKAGAGLAAPKTKASA